MKGDRQERLMFCSSFLPHLTNTRHLGREGNAGAAALLLHLSARLFSAATRRSSQACELRLACNSEHRSDHWNERSERQIPNTMALDNGSGDLTAIPQGTHVKLSRQSFLACFSRHATELLREGEREEERTENTVVPSTVASSS